MYNFTLTEAHQDIVEFLKKEDPSFFTDLGLNKNNILKDEKLIEAMTTEHHKYVCSLGCDREWSVSDACYEKLIERSSR